MTDQADHPERQRLRRALASGSLPQAFERAAAGRDDAILFRHRRRNELVAITWGEARARARRLAVALIRQGFRPGDRAAVMADNGPEWAVADLAIQAAGGAVVPVYTAGSQEQLDHVVRDSKVAFFFAGSRKYLERAAPILGSGGTAARAVVLDGGAEEAEETLPRLPGADPSPSERRELESRIAGLRRDDVSAVIYTSGTTGPPKGVVLTHGNILSNVAGCADILAISEKDVFLSLLPMSHSFERTAGFYAPLLHGGVIHFAQSAGTLARDIVEARPTLAMVVPRFLDKMRLKIRDAIGSAAGLSGAVARRAFDLRLAAARCEAEGRKVPLHLKAAAAAALRVIGGRARARFGGRVRCLFAGGAALPADLWAFYRAAGVAVCQGYGLTESAPVVSATPPGAVKAPSVGIPLRNLELKIAADGEILVRGPSVMKGYLGLPADTAGIIDADGFLHTGDVGFIDADGYLFVTDRKKDIIVSAAGKNIAPQNVENAICESPLIDFACAFGEGKNFLAAVLSPDVEALGARAAAEGWIDEPPRGGRLRDLPALLARPEVRAVFQNEVDRANGRLAPYERVLRFHVAGEPFGVETGELTPTLKVRRGAVAQKFASVIENLFRA